MSTFFIFATITITVVSLVLFVNAEHISLIPEWTPFLFHVFHSFHRRGRSVMDQDNAQRKVAHPFERYHHTRNNSPSVGRCAVLEAWWKSIFGTTTINEYWGVRKGRWLRHGYRFAEQNWTSPERRLLVLALLTSVVAHLGHRDGYAHISPRS